MATRITNNILFRSALSDVTQQRLRLARTQEQASTGLRINRLSDDPVGVRAATLLKAGIENTQQFARNIQNSESRLRGVSAALSDTNEVLIRARELALQGANGTQGGAERRLIAAEIASLHDQLVSNANRKVGGGFVFGGYASDTAPFDAAPPAPPAVWQGDSNEVRVDVDTGVSVPVTLNGERVFTGVGVSGGENLFAVLDDLRLALEADNRPGVQAMLTRIDAAQNQINVEQAEVGALESQILVFARQNDERDVDLEQRLSEVQDADSVKVFSDLVNQEVALQASLAASARMIQPSLLDFLS